MLYLCLRQSITNERKNITCCLYAVLRFSRASYLSLADPYTSTLLPSMSSSRYAPLPNPQTDPLLNDEMEAAFEEDDDDDDDTSDDHAESRPLNPASYAPSVPHTPTPGRYDFENFDYASLPPPGSPPRPSSCALPNDIGNSNGRIPSPSDVRHVDAPRASWFRRTARSVLPSSLHHRLRLDYEPTSRIVGGGTQNDGVFFNVTAKPSRPVQLREGLPLIDLSHDFLAHYLQATMFILSQKSPRRIHHPLTPRPRPTLSPLTGKPPSMRHPHRMI